MSTKTPPALDASVVELLASRICHDLIIPVGAINNGVEFLEDMGADALDDALGLIKHSAQQAAARLQAFRLAYGAGGRDTSMEPKDVQEIMGNLLRGEGKVRQAWDPHADLGFHKNPPAFCKMLMAGLMLAQECLPKGGLIFVDPAPQGEGTIIVAEGERATLREGVVDALNGDVAVEDLDPRLVHPYALSMLGAYYGYTLSAKQIEENKRVEISLTI
jgi:histidine phosphotransferase ChpT